MVLTASMSVVRAYRIFDYLAPDKIREGNLEVERSDVVEVVSTLFHLFSLCAPVVVLVNDCLADVRAVADDLIGHVVVEAVRDAAATNCVRTHA